MNDNIEKILNQAAKRSLKTNSPKWYMHGFVSALFQLDEISVKEYQQLVKEINSMK